MWNNSKNFLTMINSKMSHSSSNSEHGPSNMERTMANFVASVIVGFFQLLLSIFSTIFRTLASLA